LLYITEAACKLSQHGRVRIRSPSSIQCYSVSGRFMSFIRAPALPRRYTLMHSGIEFIESRRYTLMHFGTEFIEPRRYTLMHSGTEFIEPRRYTLMHFCIEFIEFHTFLFRAPAPPLRVAEGAYPLACRVPAPCARDDSWDPSAKCLAYRIRPLCPSTSRCTYRT